MEHLTAPRPDIKAPLPVLGDPPQLLVDVSDIIRHDPGTGIQRVVRNLTRELLCLESRQWRVEPVYVWRGRYYYARRFARQLASLPPHQQGLPDGPVGVQRGDHFLGLDWAQPMLRDAEQQLLDWGRMGVTRSVVVYDLLPLQLPHHFPAGVSEETVDWLQRLCRCSDQLLAISATVADDVNAWLDDHKPARRPAVTHFVLGGDLDALNAPPAAPDPTLVNAIQTRFTVLMVGTLDVRKGHRQALAAAELLWRRGEQFNLVIVGRQGAAMADVVDRIHQQQNASPCPPLFWLNQATDAHLSWLYQHSDLLLAASEGEGYGLPLIEAARQGLPILARDLPVFREVAGGGARFFSGNAAPSLADALSEQLHNPSPRAATKLGHMGSIATWADSARDLLSRISDSPA